MRACIAVPAAIEMEDWFGSYCRGFHDPDPEVQRNFDLKDLHTRNVLRAVQRIAAGGGERRLYLAELAAWCHDLGRFPQFQRYRTFRDSDSVNHAHLSAQVTVESGILDHLSPEERESVLTAIRLHNVFRIPSDLPPLALDLLRLVRDADKIDIWRVFIDYYALPEQERASAAGLGLPDLPSCSCGVVNALATGEALRLDSLKTLNDFKLLQLSWIYDINFTASLRLVRDGKVIEKLLSTLPREEAVLEAVEKVRHYLNRRLAADRGVQA